MASHLGHRGLTVRAAVAVRMHALATQHALVQVPLAQDRAALVPDLGPGETLEGLGGQQ